MFEYINNLQQKLFEKAFNKKFNQWGLTALPKKMRKTIPIVKTEPEDIDSYFIGKGCIYISKNDMVSFLQDK